MVKTIICLSGKKGSGKSLASDMLKEMIAPPSLEYQMASLLKKVVSAITNTDIVYLENGDFKKLLSNYQVNRYGEIEYLTYRQCLLHFGKVLRYDNDKIFIHDVINKLTRCHESVVIIPDVREIQEIKELRNWANNNNVKLYHVQILRETEKDNTSNDKTEVDLDGYLDYDYTITNNTNDPNDLKRCLKHLLNHYDIASRPVIIEATMF